MHWLLLVVFAISCSDDGSKTPSPQNDSGLNNIEDMGADSGNDLSVDEGIGTDPLKSLTCDRQCLASEPLDYVEITCETGACNRDCECPNFAGTGTVKVSCEVDCGHREEYHRHKARCEEQGCEPREVIYDHTWTWYPNWPYGDNCVIVYEGTASECRVEESEPAEQ